jgi:hypothetical protein
MPDSAQTIVVILALSAACLPFALCLRGWRRRVLAIAVVSILSVGIVWATSHSRPPSVSAEPPGDRPIEVRSDGYVSSRSCQSCHPFQYATWHASYHRTMTQVATPEAILCEFDGVELKAGPFTYNLERRGDEFWVEMDDPSWDGQSERPSRIERKVVMTTGSHHQQMYWLGGEEDRKVQFLPFTYLTKEKRWITRDASFLSPPHRVRTAQSGLWNVSCNNCHATHGKTRLTGSLKDYQTSPMDTHVAELGIACEACHGPGQEHIEANRDPLRRYRLHLGDQPDPTIVHPGRISHTRSSQVCGQCHSINYLHHIDETANWLEHGYEYRPGDELSDTRYVFQHNKNHDALRTKHLLANPSYFAEHFWSDGMVRVSGREYNGLLETPCYQRGELSCLSCHVMHKSKDDPRPLGEWANDQLKYKMDGNLACTQCHEQYESEDALVAHTHHSATSTGSNCYNCHMPHTTYGLLKAIRSHQIDVPNAETQQLIGRPNACNLCHLDKTLDWTAEHLYEWYDIQKPLLAKDDREIASSVLWILRGDAGQRALAGWSMGWQPAQQASGTDWMAPHISNLLDDPYDAVRNIAGRTLRTLPGFADFTYDDAYSPKQSREAAKRAVKHWMRSSPAGDSYRGRPLLLNANGEPNVKEIVRLLKKRDQRIVHLKE